jgi:hypothetical protein
VSSLESAKPRLIVSQNTSGKWDSDGKHMEPVVKIAAKLLRGNQDGQIAVGCGHQAYVNSYSLCTTQPLTLAPEGRAVVWNPSQAEFEGWLVMNVAAARFIFHDIQHRQGASQTAAELGQRRDLSIAEKLTAGRSLLQQCWRSQCPQSDTCHPVVTAFLTMRTNRTVRCRLPRMPRDASRAVTSFEHNQAAAGHSIGESELKRLGSAHLVHQ